MTRKTRRILFILAILAFVALGFVVTMYARGYRWDFKNNELVLSGAVYVKSLSPKEAEVALNQKSINKTTAALIKNLLPSRIYQVAVAKEGYQSWRKDFEITEGLVAGNETVVLFPESLAGAIIWPEAGLTDLAVSPNQKFAAAVKSRSKIFIRDLTDVSATATPIIFPDKRKTLSAGFLESQSWSNDSKKIFIKRAAAASGVLKAETIWYIYDTETKNLSSINALYEKQIVLKQASASPLPIKFSADKVTWFGNTNNILALINGRVFSLDIQNQEVTDLKLNEVIDFDNFENKIVALKKPDILLYIDSAVENVSVLGPAKFTPQKVLFSPEGDKIAYYDDSSLGVYWVKDTARQPVKKAGDQEVIYLGQGKISAASWHHYGEHIMFLEDQKLKVTEIDTRPPLNTASWHETIFDFDYLADGSKLFILESKAVKSIEGAF